MNPVLIRLIIALSLIFTPLFIATKSHAWDIKAMNEQIDQTNYVANANCSVTLIDRDRGIFLTANHCIEPQFSVIEREKIATDGKVTTEKVRIAKRGTVSRILYEDADEVQRGVYTFKIISADKDTDLALIKTSAKLPSTMAAKLACHNPVRGDTVYAVGNPFVVLDGSVTKGIVSSVNRNYKMIGIDDRGDHALIQSNAVIFGGNSGGALYNDSGELVGVNVMTGPPGISLSVPVSDVKDMLSREGLNDLFKGCSN